MKFENTKYFKLLKHSKVEFSFGTFYLFDRFIISELNEGIHFDWDKILEVIGFAQDHYGENINIAYISNRVNSYSIEPLLWVKFNNEFGFIIGSAIVSYTDFNFMNSSIEKHFSKKRLRRCHSLTEAIEWVRNLK